MKKSLVTKPPRPNILKSINIITFLLSTFTPQTTAQICANTLIGSVLQLMPCRPAVAAFGAELPTESCCNALKSIGQNCLCMLITGPPIAGFDRGLAMQLPAKCAANFDPCILTPSGKK